MYIRKRTSIQRANAYVFTYIWKFMYMRKQANKMSQAIIWYAAILLVMLHSQKSDGGVMATWCIADVQTPDSELQAGLDWACGGGGANCSKIQSSQACFSPNTVRAHASYAFNNYYQKFKHRGATCFFNAAAITTDLDPSHDSCHYELTP